MQCRAECAYFVVAEYMLLLENYEDFFFGDYEHIIAMAPFVTLSLRDLSNGRKLTHCFIVLICYIYNAKFGIHTFHP